MQVIDECFVVGSLMDGRKKSQYRSNEKCFVITMELWSHRNAIFLFFLAVLLLRADSWIHCHLSHHRSSRLHQLSAAHTLINERDESNFYTLPRLYVGPGTRLSDGMNFELTPEQAHYVTNVMRIGKRKSRDSIRVFDGINGEWLAQIHIEESASATQKRKRRRDDATVTAQCIRQLRPQQQELMETWLFFSPIKKQRVKLMLEKCTELGIGRFIPIVTERAEPSCVRDVLRDTDKLALQTIEASEQCERLTVPPIDIACVSSDDLDEKPWDLKTLLKTWSTQDEFRNRHLLICRERTAECSTPILKVLHTILEEITVTGVAFMIGPEGGWSRDEELLCDQYSSSSANIRCVSLGLLVLRAETAAIAAASVYMLFQEEILMIQ